MKTGLILGKFLPLHQGHMALVDFALRHCDQLIVLLCASANEPIPGAIRKQWLQESFAIDPRIRVEQLDYNEDELPNTSVSSRTVAEKWAACLGNAFPAMNLFFSSEPYGDYVADFLGIKHICYDQPRSENPVSASAILRDPFGLWQFIAPAARPWFVKKICISGSESTGKSTLTEKLAQHYNTVFVPEMARDIIGKTEEVVFDDLPAIADLHAKTINEKIKQANKLLICDTDLNITRSYAKFLFNRSLVTPGWVNEANQFDLHIFLQTDCPHVQDGTRLSVEERNRLDLFHQQQLREAGVNYISIGGNWQQRFERAVEIIDGLFFNKKKNAISPQ